MSNAEEYLHSFMEFVRSKLSSGESHLSLDELFDLWRSENPSDEMYSANVAAVEAAINDFQRGDRGTPAGQHSSELRREFGVD